MFCSGRDKASQTDSPIGYLCLNLKIMFMSSLPTQLELEQYCKEAWHKIAVSRWASLIAVSPLRLSAVIAANAISIKY